MYGNVCIGRVSVGRARMVSGVSGMVCKTVHVWSV